MARIGLDLHRRHRLCLPQLPKVLKSAQRNPKKKPRLQPLYKKPLKQESGGLPGRLLLPLAPSQPNFLPASLRHWRGRSPIVPARRSLHHPPTRLTGPTFAPILHLFSHYPVLQPPSLNSKQSQKEKARDSPFSVQPRPAGSSCLVNVNLRAPAIVITNSRIV